MLSEDMPYAEAYASEMTLREMMEEYGSDVWNYAFFLTRSREQANDISQEVFLKAYKNVGKYRGQSSMKTWLLTITRNTAVLLTSVAMILLIGALNLPIGAWKSHGPVQSSSVQSQAAGILPSSTPATNDKALEPPTSPAEFEISGKKYYMPLPMSRDKSKAYAVETTAGILWSPPPPMVDYKKPKYTHHTEPFTLYLSSKDQTELSASSATRIYTFPLYAGGASTYQYLSGFLEQEIMSC